MFKSSDTLGNNLQCWMRPKHLTFKHKAYSQHKYVSLVVTSLSHYSWGLKLDHKLSENIQRAKWPKYSKIQILYSKSFCVRTCFLSITYATLYYMAHVMLSRVHYHLSVYGSMKETTKMLKCLTTRSNSVI